VRTDLKQKEVMEACEEIFGVRPSSVWLGRNSAAITMGNPSYTLNELLKLADLFGTKNIHPSHVHRDGCETCGYGSFDEVTLEIEPEYKTQHLTLTENQ
jgi:hypothetical protein